MAYLFIIFYTIFIFVLFSLVLKRMKYLSKRQAQNTSIEGLSRGYKKVKRRLIFMIIILLWLNYLIFLTFVENDLLWKKWLHIGEKALDSDAF